MATNKQKQRKQEVNMKIAILGAAGFIGTNLSLQLLKDENNKLTLIDEKKEFFPKIILDSPASIVETQLNHETDYEALLTGQEMVFHLLSTTVPTSANQQIGQELTINVVGTANILEACVKTGVKKVVFISSGGTVYGKDVVCPITEDAVTNPITSYGIQKITIEKLLYLYHYMHGLDYRIARFANPYGPYQRPNGVLGAVTTFVYKTLKHENIEIYGDGSVVRDFIYIDDAICALLNICKDNAKHKIYNVGSGTGVSIRGIVDTIEQACGHKLKVNYTGARAVDVPENYLDITRYEEEFGTLCKVSLKEGIKKTAEFMRVFYEI